MPRRQRSTLTSRNSWPPTPLGQANLIILIRVYTKTLASWPTTETERTGEISCISPYHSDREVAPQLQLHIDTTVSVGTYVAVIDTTGDTRYHLAQVIDIGEDQTLVHYHATRGKKLRGATWRPIYKHPNTNRYVMEEPETINRADTRFTGTFPTRPTEDSLIILANVGMTGTMKIDARSRNILKKMNKYRHHIIQQTWNP